MSKQNENGSLGCTPAGHIGGGSIRRGLPLNLRKLIAEYHIRSLNDCIDFFEWPIQKIEVEAIEEK